MGTSTGCSLRHALADNIGTADHEARDGFRRNLACARRKQGAREGDVAGGQIAGNGRRSHKPGRVSVNGGALERGNRVTITGGSMEPLSIERETRFPPGRSWITQGDGASEGSPQLPASVGKRQEHG